MTSKKPKRRALDREDLRALGVDFTPNYLRKLMKAGQFPLAWRISPRRLRWNSDEVEAWIAARARDKRVA